MLKLEGSSTEFIASLKVEYLKMETLLSDISLAKRNEIEQLQLLLQEKKKMHAVAGMQ